MLVYVCMLLFYVTLIWYIKYKHIYRIKYVVHILLGFHCSFWLHDIHPVHIPKQTSIREKSAHFDDDDDDDDSLSLSLPWTVKQSNEETYFVGFLYFAVVWKICVDTIVWPAMTIANGNGGSGSNDDNDDNDDDDDNDGVVPFIQFSSLSDSNGHGIW